MSLPTDFSAIESADYSYLFYIRSGGNIAYLKSSSTTENNKTTYEAHGVKMNTNLVKSWSQRISAVSYTLGGKRCIRLYYVGQVDGDAANFKIMELCRDDENGVEGKWFEGALCENNAYCKKDTLLSANVEQGKGDLKLFFMNLSGKPAIAWVVLGGDSWSTKDVKNVEW